MSPTDDREWWDFAVELMLDEFEYGSRIRPPAEVIAAVREDLERQRREALAAITVECPTVH